MNVTHIFIHPQYNFLTRNNDLAILRLGQAIPGFHNTIEVARRNIRLLPDATICRLAGWGTLNAVSFIYFISCSNIRTFLRF